MKNHTGHAGQRGSRFEINTILCKGTGAGAGHLRGTRKTPGQWWPEAGHQSSFSKPILSLAFPECPVRPACPIELRVSR